MKKLHKTQQAVLDLLKENIEEPLTVRELQELVGASSPSVVHHHIGQLEKKGYLRRNPNNPQDYQILGTAPDKQIAYLNLYGLAHCGPRGSVLDGNPTDRVPIATRVLGFPSKDAYLVKAKGDSMAPRINNGDLVIVRRAKTAANGDVVVCVDDGEAKIKKFQKNPPSPRLRRAGKTEIILESFNPKYSPFLATKDFRVEGVVKGVLGYGF